MNKTVIKQLVDSINKNVFTQGSVLPELNGYISKITVLKRRIFIDLNDGTTIDPVKVVIERNSNTYDTEIDASNYINIPQLKIGQSIKFDGGVLQCTPHRKQPWEIKLKNLSKIKLPSAFSPITEVTPTTSSPSSSFSSSSSSISHSNSTNDKLQKNQSWYIDNTRNDYLNKYKRPFMSNILRFRSKLINNINLALNDLNFINVNAPIITNNDTEGNNETFKLVYNQHNNKKTNSNKSEINSINNNINLTVSTQLHLEILSQSLSNVYSLSPCFRAEKSDTSRHLSEFYMLELESTQYTTLDELIHLSQYLIIDIVKRFLPNLSSNNQISTFNIEKNPFLLNDYSEYPKDALSHNLVLDRWNKLIDPNNWYQIDYVDVIKQLNLNKSLFKIAPPTMDNFQMVNIASEHEKWIADKLFDGFVFIKNYPRLLKPFYMKWNNPLFQNNDYSAKNSKNTNLDDTVSCFDLIFPQIGEIIGGSVRESNIELIKKNNFASNDLLWYLELRNFGYRPTGGFGLGLERLLVYLLGLSNVKDTIPFYRSLKNKISF